MAEPQCHRIRRVHFIPGQDPCSPHVWGMEPTEADLRRARAPALTEDQRSPKMSQVHGVRRKDAVDPTRCWRNERRGTAGAENGTGA
ncbi:hypothetical protein AAFF_G00228550 [Aldrovandia affinis]|uniref:Uncharacterized protein n=1 Tax=Aldrovandia affinis TaxID=143900 RepID=A0AAD7WV54_9TELE|nr:hypothetical protein AAFF_G00228550 [Aldrovandia affinis]